jgi:hypothetical protein
VEAPTPEPERREAAEAPEAEAASRQLPAPEAAPGLPSDAPTPEPTRRLPDEAAGYFLVGALAWAVPVGIGCLVAAGALAGADAPGVLAWLLRAAAVLVVALGGVAFPRLRWRTCATRCGTRRSTCSAACWWCGGR